MAKTKTTYKAVKGAPPAGKLSHKAQGTETPKARGHFNYEKASPRSKS